MEAREKSFKSIMQESNFIQIPFFKGNMFGKGKIGNNFSMI